MLCVAGFLVTGCTAGGELTASGSAEWSRGVVLGTTEADPVAVAAWEDTTFVVWVTEGGRLRLAQLDAALETEEVTDLNLTATFPRDLRIWVEAADRLYVAWVDSEEGISLVVQALVAPGEDEPLFWQEIPLPAGAHHVEMAVRLEARQMEVFWSADHYKNSGIHHQAVSLVNDEVTPSVQLTETGWQPGVVQDLAGVLHVAWADEETRGRTAVWYARFDPESRSLGDPTLVTKVRVRRGEIFQGPALGSVGARIVVAWSIGNRLVERGFFDRHWGSRDFGGGLRSSGGAAATYGDQTQYVLIPIYPQEQASSALTETVPLTDWEAGATVQSLIDGKVVGSWKEPRLRTAGDQTWGVFSGWVVQRGRVRLQVIAVPCGEQGRGELTPVTRTWPPSVQPDLAVGADGILRAAWFEPVGSDVYQVVVASTAPEAREALGGIRLAELWDDIAGLLLDAAGLLGFTPYVLGWVILPLGLVLIGMVLNPSGVKGRQAVAWLGAAALLQLACKRFIAPVLSPFGPGPIEVALSLAPTVLGGGLMWVYWRRAKEPLLLVAYGLLAGVDAVISLFVTMPHVLWAI